MPVSPRDFALWAAATGNKYPQTPDEKMAAAPHAYDFARNLGKSGANAPGSRVGGQIVFNQPISAQFADDNSVLHSPVTPDNNISKVAGTLDNTMTGEHYDNQLRDTQEDNARSSNLVRNLGRAALASGVVAGGAILATSPEARQAVQSAVGTAQQQASNIGNRISDFLGGLGVSRAVDNEAIHNTGDVTPPTTGQRYEQERIPTSVQTLQAAKGANVGTPEKDTVPTTTASTGVKPVTESDIITSSQTFGPKETGYRSAALASYEQAVPPSESLQEARRLAATEQLQRASESIRNREPYQPEIPGVKGTLMALRSKELGITPEEAGVYQPETPTSKIGPSTTQYSLLSQTPDPWTGDYTPTSESPSQQTSDLKPTVGERVEKFITVLDIPRGEKVQVSERSLGRGIEMPSGLTGSLIQEAMPAAETVAIETTPAAAVVDAPTRQRIGRTEIPEHHAKAYEVVAAGAQRGQNISFDRALEIVTNPETALSFSEQQAFEKQAPIALAGQSFEPGARTTGQMRGVRTGEESGQRAEELLERYTRENVSGLTPKGRQSAGAQRLRGIEEQDEPRAVLTTPTGRAMRNISALDPEALAEGREEYAPFTYTTTGSDPIAAAAAYKSASSSNRVAQMNSLFGPETSKIMMHLKTEQGIKPVSAGEMQRNIRPIAENVFDRAAAYHAKQQGIELPNKEQNYGDYVQTANSVLYGNKETAAVAIPQMSQVFDQELRQRGIKMAVSQDPQISAQAMHTLMGVARGTTGGELSLEHFSKLAGRARSRGLIRSEGTQVPVGIPGPSSEQISNAMRQAGL
jgi:hypothetical protein